MSFRLWSVSFWPWQRVLAERNMAMISALLLPTISFEFQGKVWNYRLLRISGFHSITLSINVQCSHYLWQSFEVENIFCSSTSTVIVTDAQTSQNTMSKYQTLNTTNMKGSKSHTKETQLMCHGTKLCSPGTFRLEICVPLLMFSSQVTSKYSHQSIPWYVRRSVPPPQVAANQASLCFWLDEQTATSAKSQMEGTKWPHYVHWPWIPPRSNDGRQLNHIQQVVDITDAVTDVELLPPRSNVRPRVFLTEPKTSLRVHLER